MPELPEVETTVRGLNEKVLERTFVDVWTDWPKLVKKPKNFAEFKKEIKNKKIKKVRRRGKNIIFELSDGLSLLIHQKMTGHLICGVWEKRGARWEPKNCGDLRDKVNTYIHLVFFLDNGKMLALSDLRKFAKAELWGTEELRKSKELENLGPEPLEEGFTFEKFREALKDKKGKIKQVLMDQSVIAGVGNIYSDEALWRARINPFRLTNKLREDELKRIYNAVKKVLKEGIRLGGESFSDYRNIEGKKGNFDDERKVYRREGEKCPVCGGLIVRKKIGGRSAHFCPSCQK